MATLPMEYALVLKIWFKPGTLEKTLALIQKGLTQHFLFFRHAAALTCEDDITATVNITVGTGIDLTGAQVVIHFDRWWNPAKEEQATARVHRMGQRHPVQLYKLVTVGTLEEKIHTLIEQKRALAAELIVEDNGSILKTLNRKELAELFRYG